MNNKGFTLIELLVTISLLAIIASISFISITAVIKNNKIENCKTMIENIKSATKEYISDNRYETLTSTSITISTNTLVNNKYLSKINDPFNTSTDVTDKISISVNLNDDYSYKEATVYYIIEEKNNKNEIVKTPVEINCSSGKLG